MYLRRCFRRKDGKRHAYWALVESYRTNRGPRQRVVAWLGVMDEQGRLGVKRCVEKRPGHQTDLFRSTEPEWVEVDVKRVRVERSRKFGGPWLGKELLRRLALDEFLEQTLPNGREEIPWSATAMILLLARLCEPSSELHLAEHVYQASALSDLLGIPDEKVNEDRLYRALDTLLPHKKALEKHLKERLGELFDLDYDLLLYDITSTYFEGQADGNPQAQRGYSRDHRPDCKQVNIALVVSHCGMPLGYEVFAGNRHDATTLEEMVGHVEQLYGRAGRVWIMDRGLVSEKNVQFLRAGARRYILGTTKSSLRKFEPNFRSCVNKVFGISGSLTEFPLHFCLLERRWQPHTEPLQQNPLVFGRLADATFPDLHSVACRQNNIDQSDVGKLFKHLPRLIAETRLAAAGRQRLPQHVSQKTDQDMAPTRSSRWCHTGRICRSDLCTRKAASASVSCT